MSMKFGWYFAIKDDGQKRIIIRKDKHEDDYYDASTQDAANASFLKIYEVNKMWYKYSTSVEEHEKEIARLEIEAKPLPEGLAPALQMVQQAAAKKLVTKKRELEAAKQFSELLVKAEQGDVEAVKEVLWKRKDGEYEGIRIVVLK